MSTPTRADRSDATGASSTHAHGAFDPLSELFIAQAHRPAHWRNANLRTMTPFQRALLVIDGTVTKFIEAYTMEAVDVVRLSQCNHELGEAHRWLDAPAGAEVADRQVFLRGSASRSLYAYATSLLVMDRLTPEVLQGVDLQAEGLGRILLGNQLENRREVLWYGREHIDGLPPPLDKVVGGEFISRTYRIVSGGRPIMLISEKFPARPPPLPSHH